MKKLFVSMSMVSMMALLPAAVQAGQYEQRVIATTTILGATTGAIIGSGNDQTAQGAVLGALVGATAGVLVAQNDRDDVPVSRTVVYENERYHRPVYREVHVHRYGPREMVRINYVRDRYGRPVKQVVHVHQARYERQWNHEADFRNHERHERYERDRYLQHEARNREHFEREYARNW